MTQKQQDPSKTDIELDLPEEEEEKINDALNEMQKEKKRSKKTSKSKSKEKHTKTAVTIAVVGIGVFIAVGIINANVSSSSGSYSSYDEPERYTENKDGTIDISELSTVEIEGDTYSFPIKVKDLEENGWTLSSSSKDEPLPEKLSGSFYYAEFTRDENHLRNVTINGGGGDEEEVPVENAYVYSIDVSEYENTNMKIVLPYGSYVGEDEDDLEDALDDANVPYEVTEYDDYSYYRVNYYDNSKSYYFDARIEDDEITDISLDYYE